MCVYIYIYVYAGLTAQFLDASTGTASGAKAMLQVTVAPDVPCCLYGVRVLKRGQFAQGKTVQCSKKNWLMIVVDYTRKYTLPSQYIGDYNRIQ